jgi:hypothetical protein
VSTRWTKRLVAAGAAIAILGFATTRGGVVDATSPVAHRWAHHPAAAASAAPLATKGDLVLHELFGPQFTFVDVGEKGDSPGDYGVFRDPVAKPGTHERVGFVDVQCVEAYSSHCRGSIRLSGQGQITFDGATPGPVDPDRFAVTGGTGKLRGISGDLVVSFPSDDYAVLTLHLIWPS